MHTRARVMIKKQTNCSMVMDFNMDDMGPCISRGGVPVKSEP